jgi:hypothetical protein
LTVVRFRNSFGPVAASASCRTLLTLGGTYMDSRRVALVASWSGRYIDDHRRWLDLHGPHWDGWSNKLSPHNRSLIEKTIASHRRVNFYAYMSLSQGGDGTVRYRLGLDDFTYHWPAEPFKHAHGDHGGPEPYSAVFVFRLGSVEELTHAHEIAEFTTVAGKTLSPRAMRGLYVVDEIAVGATA